MQFLSTFVKTYLQGIAIGIAEIIPGVSGSTVALLLGIYDDFIDLLFQATQLVKVILFTLIGKNSIEDIKKAFFAIRWQFGITLGLGMITSIISLSSFILFILTTYPHLLFAFLIGLTPPTIYIVYKQIDKLTLKNIAIAFITTVLVLGIFLVGDREANVTNPHPLYLFFGGIAGISAMVLPGISGSFILLILGLYSFVIGLVASAKNGLSMSEITSLIIFISGLGAGLLTTVRLIKWAFEHVRNELMSFLLGLMIASAYVLWPFVKVTAIVEDEPVFERVGIFAFSLPSIALIVGIATITCVGVYALHNWADSRDQKSPKKDDGFDKL